MTYEEIVYRVRDRFEYADARAIFVHIAVQVNIVGEGSGAFYIEVANREISVEPYDYHDRDVLITSDAATIIEIADGKLSLQEAVKRGHMKLEGNMEKLKLLSSIKFAD